MRDCLANAQGERVSQRFFETLGLNHERVRGGFQIYESEVTTLIGGRLGFAFGRLIDQLNYRPRHGRAVRIGHRSINFSGGCLRL